MINVSKKKDHNGLKIIAFYLPQFHPIPENDEWWGNGFTEWRNVKSAVSAYPGHRQPRVPTKTMGYYDLRNERTQVMQASFASRYGVSGFCYYYYWFGGKKLLYKPLENVITSGKPNFPFCICWANHEWTRAWYGQNKQVLITQDYSKESMKMFIHDIAEILSDKRYIRIGGRPLLCVYQAEELPNSIEISEIWREEAHKLGLGDIFLVNIEALCWGYNPSMFGFDAAVEFAPDWRLIGELLNSGCKPRRVDYRATVARMLAKPKPDYKLFRGVFPQWDNSPRYKKAALVFDNSSPELFGYHLNKIIEYTVDNFSEDERYVFINAWNEWGEGCYLEPCEDYGLSYLEAVKSAVFSSGI